MVRGRLHARTVHCRDTLTSGLHPGSSWPPGMSVRQRCTDETCIPYLLLLMMMRMRGRRRLVLPPPVPVPDLRG